MVTAEYMNMVYSAIAYFALVGAGWLFLRLLQACFLFPKRMRRQQNIQQMLQSKVNYHFYFNFRVKKNFLNFIN